MATAYQVRVGLDLLRRAGLGTDVVTHEHLALTPHPMQAAGTVANWLAGMPSTVYADVVDEAHRRIGGTEFVHAERAVAILITLLPEDHLPSLLAGMRPYDERYGDYVDLIDLAYADHAAQALTRRPQVLLDHACEVTRLMTAQRLPLVDRADGLILPRLCAAIRSALVWHRVTHSRQDTAALLTTAVDHAQW